MEDRSNSAAAQGAVAGASAAAAPDGADATAAAPPRRVDVALPGRAYPVHIGHGLLESAGELLAEHAPRRRAAIITDQSVAWRHLDTLWRGLSQAGFDADAVTLPPGEKTKSFEHLETVLNRLFELRLERDDLIIGFGGGVIGDLSGFAAAVFRRGAPFAQIPTTLLAQVDSSVGGKTAINSPHGKNLIGAFHQPVAVIADVATLDTLPMREIRAGYAEVVKYGLLGDAGFFAWLEANAEALMAGGQAERVHAVETSVAAKARIVVEDEQERGRRALLNLGHTFGHALEAATGYGARLLHGEAVSIGMALAFELSARLGVCPPDDAARVRAHLRGAGLKTTLADIGGDLPNVDTLLAAMAQDKKVRAGRSTYILARGIGQAYQSQDVDPDAVRRLLAEELFAASGD